MLCVCNCNSVAVFIVFLPTGATTGGSSTSLPSKLHQARSKLDLARPCSTFGTRWTRSLCRSGRDGIHENMIEIVPGRKPQKRRRAWEAEPRRSGANLPCLSSGLPLISILSSCCSIKHQLKPISLPFFSLIHSSQQPSFSHLILPPPSSPQSLV
jgi:hypothetical protein